MQSLSIKVKKVRQLNHSSWGFFVVFFKIQLKMLPRYMGVTEPSRDYHPQFLTFDFYLTTHLYNVAE